MDYSIRAPDDCTFGGAVQVVVAHLNSDDLPDLLITNDKSNGTLHVLIQDAPAIMGPRPGG